MFLDCYDVIVVGAGYAGCEAEDDLSISSVHKLYEYSTEHNDLHVSKWCEARIDILNNYDK